MKKIFSISIVLVILPLLSLFISSRVAAQSRSESDQQDKLYRTIASLDSAVFEAFNNCELEKLGSFFTEDLEFYHDKDGLSRTRQTLVDDVKKYICGKVRRELVPGTLEVYPLAGYGAVEIGVHRFYSTVKGNTESPGEAKFIHIWQNSNGNWKITRVISFDHQSTKQ